MAYDGILLYQEEGPAAVFSAMEELTALGMRILAAKAVPENAKNLPVFRVEEGRAVEVSLD